MGQNIALIVCYGIVYAVWGHWIEKYPKGQSFAKFIQEWKADGHLHWILCMMTIITFGIAGIFALALTLNFLGF